MSTGILSYRFAVRRRERGTWPCDEPSRMEGLSSQKVETEATTHSPFQVKMENLSTLLKMPVTSWRMSSLLSVLFPKSLLQPVKIPLQSPHLMGRDPVPYLVPVQCPAPALFSLPVPCLRVQFPSPLPLSLWALVNVLLTPQLQWPSLVSLPLESAALAGRAILDITVAACHPWDLQAYSPHLSPLLVQVNQIQTPCWGAPRILPQSTSCPWKAHFQFLARGVLVTLHVRFSHSNSRTF